MMPVPVKYSEVEPGSTFLHAREGVAELMKMPANP
jgi:hypothetical protein